MTATGHRSVIGWLTLCWLRSNRLSLLPHMSFLKWIYPLNILKLNIMFYCIQFIRQHFSVWYKSVKVNRISQNWKWWEKKYHKLNSNIIIPIKYFEMLFNKLLVCSSVLDSRNQNLINFCGWLTCLMINTTRANTIIIRNFLLLLEAASCCSAFLLAACIISTSHQKINTKYQFHKNIIRNMKIMFKIYCNLN